MLASSSVFLTFLAPAVVVLGKEVKYEYLPYDVAKNPDTLICQSPPSPTKSGSTLSVFGMLTAMVVAATVAGKEFK